jgi:urease subunit gamma
MHFRELDKLMIHMMADVALKRKAKGLKLNHREAVAVIAAAALEGGREGKRLQQLVGWRGSTRYFARAIE